jgi:23S rRNA pseudouridine2605 synthase
MAARRTPAARRQRARRGKGAAAPRLQADAGPTRLQKLLAAAGFGSRRGAEVLIEQGRVSVNGQVAKVGDSADPATDRIELDGEALVLERPLYWMLNKPRGVLTTARDTHGRRTVLDLLPDRMPRLFPVGRLDVETEGLVLLTNDGALANALLHPSLGSEREYRVTVRGSFDSKAQKRIERGLHLDDGKTAAAEISRLRANSEGTETVFHLVLREGRKRQIRRSMLVVGFPVKKLARVRMGPLRMGRLARGEARPLEDAEIKALRKHREELEAKRTARPRGRGGRSPRRGGPRKA